MKRSKEASQIEGVAGRGVEWMIRRSLRSGLRGVYWIPPEAPLARPVVLACNHHGWYDGYVMLMAALALDLPVVDWIQEFDAFPLFAKVGGMPFPAGDTGRRATTIRKTIRLMNEGSRNLLLFPEGVLHRPPLLMPFGKSLDLIVRHVPKALVVPVAIRYDMAMHERPEAFIQFGAPLEPGPDTAERARRETRRQLDLLAYRIEFEPEKFQTLLKGTPDVNERWDYGRIMDRFRPRRS